MPDTFDTLLLSKWDKWIDRQVWRYLAHFPPSMRQYYDDLHSEAVLAFLETVRACYPLENGVDLPPLLIWRCSKRIEYAMRSWLWSLCEIRDIHSAFAPRSLAFSDCPGGTADGDLVSAMLGATAPDDTSAMDLRDAVSTLPETDRKLIRMLSAGFTRAEAAEALRIHPSTVTRALQSVRDRLEKEETIAYSAS